MQTWASMKPIPEKKPSATEGSGLFFEAKLSALARIMQLTTIRGMKTPRDADSDGI